MKADEAQIEVRRGGIVESRHRVSAVLVDERGELIGHLGDPERGAYWRSAAKPFQALPLFAASVVDTYDFSPRELAVCCASHSGEPPHVATVLGLLKRVGFGEDDLECGAHEPFHKPSAAALRTDGRAPTKVHNNCSGKHTGMLALAKQLGVEPRGYRKADHAVQARIRSEIADWTQQDAATMNSAIDGCGVLTYSLPLVSMAEAYARLVAEAARDPEAPAGVIVQAMTSEPYYVGGTGRLETDLMRATDGRILAKVGAEGIFCLADRERAWGAAFKIEDGNKRAFGPSVLEFLTQLGMLSADESRELDDHRVASVENTVGEIVASIHPVFEVRRSR